MTISDYLFEKVDEKICLYRSFIFSDTRFNEQDMTLVDLNSFCDENDTSEGCFNFLRFTDQENPQQLKHMTNNPTDIPTFSDQVDCE